VRSAQQRKQAVLLLAIVGVVVAGVLGTFAWQKLTRPNIGSDNCLYEDKRFLRKKVANQTIVVIDQSEDLSPSHKRQVKELLLDYIVDDKQLPVRSSVLLYVFGKNDFQPTGAGQDLKPEVNLCRPPSSGNEVIENRRKIEKTFHARFIRPLYESIDKSLNLALGERSPILEMLQYLSRTQDIKEGNPGARPKKALILVSDMLQHSAYLSTKATLTMISFVLPPC
jgi:hypothetical protein